MLVQLAEGNALSSHNRLQHHVLLQGHYQLTQSGQAMITLVHSLEASSELMSSAIRHCDHTGQKKYCRGSEAQQED